MADKLEVTSGWYTDREQVVYRTVAECYISPEFIIGIIQGKYEADPAIFPADVQVRGGKWDEISNSFKIVLESKSYPKTPEGNALYTISLRLRHKTDA